MTNGNLETRIAALEAQMQEIRETLKRTAESQERTQRLVEVTLDIANSNARSLQAWEARIEENRTEAEEEQSELRVGLNELRESMADLVQLARRNEVEHELFRLRFEAIDPLVDDEPSE